MYKYQTYEDIKATDEFKRRKALLEEKPETNDEYINWVLAEVALCKEFYDKANYFAEASKSMHSFSDGTIVKFDVEEIRDDKGNIISGKGPLYVLQIKEG